MPNFYCITKPITKKAYILKKLHQYRVGDKVTIQDYSDDCQASTKLLSLGILPGDQVQILAKAIFGGPISLRHNNSFFALRKSHASKISVSDI
jgi:ferrous iron transport protein A